MSKRKHYLPCVTTFRAFHKNYYLIYHHPSPKDGSYGGNCFNLLIGLQDISILIPDFYDILELEENSETGSLNNGLDNPNQLPEDKKGKTSFCKIITITNQEVLQVYCIQKLLKMGFE